MQGFLTVAPPFQHIADPNAVAETLERRLTRESARITGASSFALGLRTYALRLPAEKVQRPTRCNLCALRQAALALSGFSTTGSLRATHTMRSRLSVPGMLANFRLPAGPGADVYVRCAAQLCPVELLAVACPAICASDAGKSKLRAPGALLVRPRLLLRTLQTTISRPVRNVGHWHAPERPGLYPTAT